jgi:hypothetical protein
MHDIIGVPFQSTDRSSITMSVLLPLFSGLLCLLPHLGMAHAVAVTAPVPWLGQGQDERELLLEQLRELRFVETQLADSSLALFSITGVVTASEALSELLPLLSQLRALILQREYALYSVTAHSPEVARLDYSIAMQRKIVLEAVGSVRGSLCSRLKALNRMQAARHGTTVTGVESRDCQ